MTSTLVIAKTVQHGRTLADALGLEAIVIPYDASPNSLARTLRGLRVRAILFDDLRQALRDLTPETLDLIASCQIW